VNSRIKRVVQGAAVAGATAALMGIGVGAANAAPLDNGNDKGHDSSSAGKEPVSQLENTVDPNSISEDVEATISDRNVKTDVVPVDWNR
jgi:hypothetical protein